MNPAIKEHFQAAIYAFGDSPEASFGSMAGHFFRALELVEGEYIRAITDYLDQFQVTTVKLAEAGFDPVPEKVRVSEAAQPPKLFYHDCILGIEDKKPKPTTDLIKLWAENQLDEKGRSYLINRLINEIYKLKIRKG